MRSGTSSLGRDVGVLPARPSPPLIVAVSDCLTGAAVRYDGGHKKSSLCHRELAGLFELRGVCPEVAIGMGVPRAPIRLVGDAERPAARGIADPTVDVTERLRDYARNVVPSLADVDGYIFMQRSPSCGLHRVPVYDARAQVESRATRAQVESRAMRARVESRAMRAQVVAKGRGVFAAAIVAARPELPVEESGRLDDAVLRENFVTRVFAHAHWRLLIGAGLTPAALIAFHSAYKYLLMAHSVTRYRAAGRLLADLSGGVEARANAYIELLMAGLARPATRGGHANVLQHLQGYVKDALDSDSRRELAEAIDAYRRGELPLLAPLTLLRHHLREVGDAYALAQIYLEPHPPSAGLRRSL